MALPFAKQLLFVCNNTYWDVETAQILFWRKADQTCFWAAWSNVVGSLSSWNTVLHLALVIFLVPQYFPQKSLIKMLVYKGDSCLGWSVPQISTKKTEACNTSKSIPWDCSVWWLGMCSAVRMLFASWELKLVIFSNFGYCFARLIKLTWGLQSHCNKYFEIFTHWICHQLYLHFCLFRPNTETNVNYLGFPLESAVRVMGKAQRILAIKIAPRKLTGKKWLTNELPHSFLLLKFFEFKILNLKQVF